MKTTEQSRLRIHLYTACWNEERIIPFFLRHYEPLVDRIIVYDDQSTDNSAALLRASPKVELRPFVRTTESFLEAQVTLFETCWQESRGQADWVCVADVDEFLFHPEWHRYLAAEKQAGITLLRAIGYEMVSENFPAAETDLATTLTRGQRDLHFDKLGLFVPDAIEQINYTVGRHLCAPTGQVVTPKGNRVQLRHYKALGFDYLLTRTQALAGRLSSYEKARGWSSHYLQDEDYLRNGFLERLAKAEPVRLPARIKPVNQPPKKTNKKPWWRLW